MEISKTRFFSGWIVIALLLLSGCAASPKPPYEMKSPQMGMIYGNIHIDGHEVTEVELREYDKLYIPPFITPPRVMVFRNGDFVAENLRPGNYYIARFVSKKLFYTLVKDTRSAYQRIVTVEPGSVNYIGSFEITDVTPGFYRVGDFNISTVRHPSERKILKHMYEITEGTSWQDRIRRRIISLR